MVASLSTRAVAAFQTWRVSERGASMVEYAFLISLIAMAAFLAVTFLGQALNNKYDTISNSVSDAGT